MPPIDIHHPNWEDTRVEPALTFGVPEEDQIPEFLSCVWDLSLLPSL